ncbi:MAG: hypothetical protein E6X17_16725 [Sporomusaceae bacterium]|nr:hypothetical protein [Sporomusaceae bacterium]
MCTACHESARIFAVEIATVEPVETNMELYKAIAHRLFEHKVISHINIGGNRAYQSGDRQLFGFNLHLSNHHDQLRVSLENVEQALRGLLQEFAGYSDLQIKPV